jgi:general secretion pathway protein E
MTPQPSSTPFGIDQAHLRRARNRARESGRSVMAELEHLNSNTSDELVRQVAKLFGMTPIYECGLSELTPAFDLLPLTLAHRWQCLLFRDAYSTLFGVLADPFDPDLQLWLNTQARGAVLMRLASSKTLQNYLHQSISISSKAPKQDLDCQIGLEQIDQEQVALQIQEITRVVLQQAMRR